MAAKPKPSPITDSVILDLMNRGIIELRDVFTSPIVLTNGKIRKIELNEQGGRRRIHGGKRFRVEIKYVGHRRKIMLSRLLWLWFFGIIPPEHEIHHSNEDGRDDRIGNLQCWHTDTHKLYHYGATDDSEF